ncbi:S8 family peptidase [Candidatus Bipolaricaulota bacterium]|nr:S8 family peptidase [Candidatus Bipolaricaulota bacterium]
MNRFFSPVLSTPLIILLLVGLFFYPVAAGPTDPHRVRKKADPMISYLIDAGRDPGTERVESDLATFVGSLDLYRDGIMTPAGGKLPKRTGVGVGVTIKFTEPASHVRLPGLETQTTVGKVATGIVDVASLDEIVRRDDVVYVSPARPVYPSLTVSVPAIGADSLHGGSPVDRGTDVLVGVVDSGIDYDHLDFRDDADDEVPGEESSRISFIWDQTDGYSFPPAGYSYGSEYTRGQIESDIAAGYGPSTGSVRVEDSNGHGTHVSGVIASDGSSSDLGFVGVAPEASLIVVKTTFSTNGIIDGVSYIKEKAFELGKAVVITNLSLGTQAGPHDGTSLFEQGISSLVSDDHLITVSAGNSGDKKIHLGLDAYPGLQAEYSVDLPSYSASSVTSDYFSLDGFYGAGGDLEAKMIGPDGQETDWVGTGQADSFVLSSGSVYISNGETAYGGDNELYVRVGDMEPDTPPDPGRWNLVITSNTDARLDIWLSDNLLGGRYRALEFNEGDSNMTIAEPGNAYGVVTVGSFNTRDSWNGSSIGGYPTGLLSGFSSKGPTRDGRPKPDLVAPGAWVLSTLSAEASVDSYYLASDGKHYAMAGTSVSAPHVAGSAALVWYAAPEVTSEEVRESFLVGADSANGFSQQNDWGAGKLNVKQSVFGVSLPDDEDEGDLWVRVTPNPAQDYVDLFYSYPEDSPAPRIEVYNVLGQLVKEVAGSQLEGGMKYRWDLTGEGGSLLANGLYIYLIRTDDRRSDLSRLVIRR